jgi:monomeric isocitrate dehydrogenase
MTAQQPNHLHADTTGRRCPTYAFADHCAFTEPAGIDVKTSDISVAARILAESVTT